MYVHKMTRSTATVLMLAAIGGYIGQTQTFARPQYAAAEGISCAYCHNNPAGGGPRNFRGKYYGGHKRSFAGFDEYGAAISAGQTEGFTASTEKPKTAAGPSPLSDAHAKVVEAQAAHEKMPDDAALKKAYVESLNGLSHAVLEAKGMRPAKAKFEYALKVANDTLGLDPGNAAATADKKTAEDALKAIADKAAAAKGDAGGAAPAAPAAPAANP